MASKKEIDFGIIKEMDEDQQAQVYYTLAKRANQRFRDIEGKSKLHSFAVDKAKEYLMDTYGRTTFKQTKGLRGLELKENLKKLEEFYTSKTSTAKGIREVQKQRLNTFKEKFKEVDKVQGNKGKDKLETKFNKMMKDKEKKDNFYKFLRSRQYQTLIKNYLDSDQLVEDFTKASDEGFSIDEIMTQYEIFQNSEMTFEQVDERRAEILKTRKLLQ